MRPSALYAVATAALALFVVAVVHTYTPEHASKAVELAGHPMNASHASAAAQSKVLNSAPLFGTSDQMERAWSLIKRNAWLHSVSAVTALPVPLSAFRDPIRDWAPFGLITPTFQCDPNRMHRTCCGDGGKWVCGMDFDSGCVIFSLGSAGNFMFEDAIVKLSKSKCQVHTFDCTGSWMHPSTIFHPWCIARSDFVLNNRAYKTVRTILRELGLKRIDLLKMDIEGYEWQVLPELISALEPDQLPRQILFELHYEDSRNNVPELAALDRITKDWAIPTIRLFQRLDAVGYRTAMIERNAVCPWCCEFVVVLPQFVM